MPDVQPSAFDRYDAERKLRDFSRHWRKQVDAWRQAGAGHTEKSYAQQFWSDLLKCFGVIPERISLFERDARRATTGRTGFIDLFWSGAVIGEAKSLGGDLDRAYDQVNDYLSGGSIGQHEWPKFVLISDFENLRVTRLGEKTQTWRFTIDEVVDHLDLLKFLAGQEEVTKGEEVAASIQASKLMADMYTAMLGEEADAGVGEEAARNPEDEDAAVQRTSMWMTRLLFLLFGDDAGLWEADLFYRWVLEETRPENLGSQMTALFHVLNTEEGRRRGALDGLMARFPHVNGSLFEYTLEPEFFDKQFHDALIAACRFRWNRISPAVFGAMFQLVKSKEARRAGGEHYTTETNILKVIEPLFLGSIRDEAARLIKNKSTSESDLRAFQQKLAQMIFLDPACGCGNFLVVAYRELRAIETSIIVALRKKQKQATASMDISLDQKLTIDQFHGFELNWWPAKIAETAMFLVDHQANQALADAVGDAPRRLPIKITAHIHHGNALRMDWNQEIPTAPQLYVFGNPPFIGQKEKSPEQVEDMKLTWGDRYDGYLDYCTGWHAKSIQLLQTRKGEFAYVTTNSIVQGQPVAAFYGLIADSGWRIKFAHRTFEWTSEAAGRAAVHCVVIGFTRDRGIRQRMWDYTKVTAPAHEVPVAVGINPYLVDGPVVLITKRMTLLSPALPPVLSGSKAVDWERYTIEDPAEYDLLATDPIIAKYLRPYVGGKELINNIGRWCLWFVDLDPKDVAKSPELKRRIDEVRELRAKSNRPATLRAAAWPHLFGENRQPVGGYLGIPQTFTRDRRYATVARLDGGTIASIKLFTAEDPDGYLFAMLSSSMFLTWQFAVGGRIKSDPSFSNTIVWNNFPLGEMSKSTRKRIIAAGEKVLAARALQPDRSLADQYRPLSMNPELTKAHDALDREVDVAFGAPRKLTTSAQRLDILFMRYLEMTRDEKESKGVSSGR
ncbi:methylase [Mycolicibacterium murale]|uniref:site-specific DNA-methyltransferase (adenine-specific) n=3 Tax=Mycolicibacterium murale TaxID=182220 RepID=A0A7I9WDR6_9MYCO|nr:class I SAM-dependent DNA methyltransferase [Mycolicibacterium murale]MCV7180560.1 class I SAM-dependent DNA methyltransferase [Mycolicibacterium murale]GFG55871.1 methylase [Mycolicibacterium murale]